MNKPDFQIRAQKASNRRQGVQATMQLSRNGTGDNAATPVWGSVGAPPSSGGSGDPSKDN